MGPGFGLSMIMNRRRSVWNPLPGRPFSLIPRMELEISNICELFQAKPSHAQIKRIDGWENMDSFL